MKLDRERKKIDRYDKYIAKLFQKRLIAVNKIGIYKKENNLEVLDLKREENVINKNKKYIDEKYQELYIDLIKKIMEISKRIE